jgi:uncharacterized Tic20 family protein
MVSNTLLIASAVVAFVIPISLFIGAVVLWRHIRAKRRAAAELTIPADVDADW